MPLMNITRLAHAPRRFLLASSLLLLAIGSVLAIDQLCTVQAAHSSFENYYVFRGCQQLLTRAETTATCRLSSGQIIKIVEVGNKWYLDGDLPVCWVGHSLCW